MPNRSELGYRIGNLKDLDDRFKCSHCHLLLKEPMQADCGHRYCKNCVLIKYNEATKNGHESLCSHPDCDLERTEISPDKVYPDNALNREIYRSLQVQCPNTPCEQVMLLKNLLEDHMLSCEFRPEKCDLCGEFVSAAKLLSDHKVNDCPKRIVACDACQDSVAFDFMEEHKNSTCICVAAEMPREPRELDYEEVQNLKEKARNVEGRLLDLTSSSVAQNLDDKRRATDLLMELQSVVTQGDKTRQLIKLIKNRFDSCMETIRQYEIKMQKAMEKKLDMERRNQELTKLLLYKEIKISHLERRADILEFAGFEGALLWKISSVRRRMEEARQGTVRSFYSFPFFTSKAGYKMCGRLYLNGDGAGLNTHISLYFAIMRGSYDALLPWPFAQKGSMTLVDQRFEQHTVFTFKPDPKSASFRRPATEMNVASGCSTFVSLKDFEDLSRVFVIDDAMFIRFMVDKTDLREV